jgi:hypothetical protein
MLYDCPKGGLGVGVLNTEPEIESEIGDAQPMVFVSAGPTNRKQSGVCT